MKKVLIAVLLCVFCFGLISCGNGNKNMPATNAVVVGNGGQAVQKGDYLYFVNGFLSRDTITTDNRKKNDYVNGGLYVTKLDADGKILLNSDGSIKYIKRLSGSIVGQENTNLYIFGDYLYYTTPNTNLTKDGKAVTNNLLNFYRMKLDGSKNEKILTSSGDADNINFRFYEIDGKVHLLLFDDGKLSVVEISKKIGSVKTVCKDVSSVAFDGNSWENVYYTANLTDDEKEQVSGGNKLVKYNIKTNKSKIIKMDNKAYALLDAKNSNIYVYISDAFNAQRLYKASYASINNDVTAFIKLTGTAYTQIYVLDNKTPDSIKGLLVRTSTGAMKFVYDGQDDDVDFMAVAPNVVWITEKYLYYTENTNLNKLMRINLKKNATGSYDIATIFSDENTAKLETKFVDITDRFVFMFVNVPNDNGTKIYLYRVDMQSFDEDRNYLLEHIGVFAKGDEPLENDE